ncbi:MAG: glycosyltransferase family A protein [Longimicrobiales bacterium]|nr:glycosyltransferase family A protein [Longimicrobiales bacterium]
MTGAAAGGTPPVSVVIATWNAAGLVPDAIEGCLAQTVRPQVIVVDDGSTDDTVPLLRERYGQAIVLLTQPNAERGAARNTGAARADAEILIFLDADDRLRPTHVETVLELARTRPDAALWATGGVEVDRDFRPLAPIERTPPGPITLDAFLAGDHAVLLPFGVRARAVREIGGFVEERELMGSEDWLLTARLLARGDGVRAAAVTVEKRTHGANTMLDAAMMERAMRGTRARLFGRHRAEVAARVDAIERAEDRARRAMLRNLAATCYGAGEMARARAIAREAAGGSLRGVLADPALRRSWLRSWLGAPLTRGLRRLRGARG